MKAKYVIFLLTTIFAFSASVVGETQPEKSKSNFKKTAVFSVSMTCENCKRKIEKNIAFEKGVKDMRVELESKLVSITFDARKNDEQKLIEAFNKLGYEAYLIDEPQKQEQELENQPN